MGDKEQKQGKEVSRRDMLKGAAGAGLGVVAAGLTTEQAAAAVRVASPEPREVKSPHNVRDLIFRMADDHVFAGDVLASPESFKAEYGLSPRTVMTLRSLRIEDFRFLGAQDARSFATGAMVSAGMIRRDFGYGLERITAADGTGPLDQDPGGDTNDVCYYFG